VQYGPLHNEKDSPTATVAPTKGIRGLDTGPAHLPATPLVGQRRAPDQIDDWKCGLRAVDRIASSRTSTEASIQANPQPFHLIHEARKRKAKREATVVDDKRSAQPISAGFARLNPRDPWAQLPGVDLNDPPWAA
jgi:hypothetical protein